MTFCSSCGKKNPPDAGFCVYCGQKIISNESNKCSQCGAEVKEDMAFCPTCGNKIGSAPQKDQINNLNDIKTTQPQISAKDEILEVMLIAGREKGKTLAQKRTMIFYKNFLIMAKGGSMAAGLFEGLGWALGGAAGGSIGKSME